MSESHKYKALAESPWHKLQAFLDFRIMLEGIWIKDPKFWFEAITEEFIEISTELYTDSGGGPLHTFCIKVSEPGKVLLDMSLNFAEVWSDSAVFVARMKAMYRYMKSYSEGNTWFERACWSHGDEDGFVDGGEWDKCFGPLQDVGRVPFKDLSDIRNTYPAAGFQLLGGLAYVDPSEVHFSGGTAKLVKASKEWALMALLDMERYFFAVC